MVKGYRDVVAVLMVHIAEDFQLVLVAGSLGGSSVTCDPKTLATALAPPQSVLSTTI